MLAIETSIESLLGSLPILTNSAGLSDIEQGLSRPDQVDTQIVRDISTECAQFLSRLKSQ